MMQISLLDNKGRDPTARYNRGNEQSREAWKSLNPERLSNLRRRVFYFIKGKPGGAMCEDIEFALELSHQTASARCTELKKLGFITPAGSRATRSGRKAAVYTAII